MRERIEFECKGAIVEHVQMRHGRKQHVNVC